MALVRKRRRGVLAVVVAVSFLTTACGSSGGGASSASQQPTTTAGSSSDPKWAAIVKAAEAEGQVTPYVGTGTPEQGDALVKAFQDAYPAIKVNWVRDRPAVIEQRVDAELQTAKGEGDVIFTADRKWLDQKRAAGNLTTVDVPNFHDADIKSDWIVGNSIWLGLAAMTTWAWNTSLVPGGIHSPDDFFKPEVVGRVGISEPSNAYAVNAFQQLEDLYGSDFIERIVRGRVHVYDSNTAILQGLASGEVAASFYASSVQTIIDQGAPVAFTVPKEPWIIPVWGGIPKSSPHPNAALVFADFLASPAGQAAYRRGDMSLHKGQKGTLAYAGDYKLADIASVTQPMIDAYKAKYGVWLAKG